MKAIKRVYDRLRRRVLRPGKGQHWCVVHRLKKVIKNRKAVKS